MTRHEPDPIQEISKIQREMFYFGVELLRPHIVKSDMDFNIEDKNIRFGLLSIKGISEKSIEKLNNFIIIEKTINLTLRLKLMGA